MRLHRLPWLFWAGLAGFVLLTTLVATGVVDGLDRAVLNFCTRHRHPTLAAAAHHLTNAFSPATDAACLGIGAGTLGWRRRRPAIFLVAGASGWLMAVVVLVTKAAVARPLPDRTTPARGGFPSGHTAAFLVCFGTLVFLATTRHRQLRPRLLAAVAVMTTVIAAALVYDSSHWLTDTVASASLGVALLALLARFLGRRRTSPRGVPRAPAPDDA